MKKKLKMVKLLPMRAYSFAILQSRAREIVGFAGSGPIFES